MSEAAYKGRGVGAAQSLRGKLRERDEGGTIPGCILYITEAFCLQLTAQYETEETAHAKETVFVVAPDYSSPKIFLFFWSP